MKKNSLFLLLLLYIGGMAQPAADAIATIGQPLPAWQTILAIFFGLAL